MKPIVIKLGGSVITEKSIPFKVNDHLIDSIAKEIYASNRVDLILIHGGGSVGHYVAKKIGFGDGRPKKSELLSYLLLEMDKLTIRILSHLVENGVPSVSLPTHALAFIGDDGTVKLDFEPIRLALTSGFIPLLRGDLVLSVAGTHNHKIVSGDLLASEISKEFMAEKLIMCIDQDGIIGPDGKLIEELSIRENYEQYIWPDDLSRSDVTGGMRAKLESLKEVARLGIPSFFLCPFRRGRLLNAIIGKPFRGTRIKW